DQQDDCRGLKHHTQAHQLVGAVPRGIGVAIQAENAKAQCDGHAADGNKDQDIDQGHSYPCMALPCAAPEGALTPTASRFLWQVVASSLTLLQIVCKTS